jgi:hypothetical protein
MGKGVVFLFLFFGCVVAQGQFKNIKLVNAETGGSISPVVAVSIKNPNIVVVGLEKGRAFYTSDGGVVWSESKINTTVEVQGIPYVVSDHKGDFYFFYGALQDRHQIGTQKSEDGGKTWIENGWTTENPVKDQYTPRVSMPSRKSHLYFTWTQFDQYALNDKACLSHLMFSTSSSGGKKWTAPVQISRDPGDCMNNGLSPAGAMPAISLDGKLYLAWSNQETIFFDRSYDGGETWLNNDLSVAKQKGSWEIEIPGMGRTSNLPTLVINNSTDRYHGSLYLVWADQTTGAEDTDIWLIRSSNRGDNWTSPQRINKDEPGKHQFTPKMAVDQTTGYIYIVYYDRRNYDDTSTDVYMAYSVDGGSSFKEIKISEDPFVANNKNSSGELIDISAHKGIIVPVWTRVEETSSNVLSTVIKESELMKQK